MTPRKRTNSYWEKRSQEQLTHVEQKSLKHLREIDRVLHNAQKQILSDVKDLYEVAYKKNGFDVQSLREIAPKGDVRRFREAVSESGLAKELPDGYGYRLNRLELLEAQTWLEIHKVAKKQQTIQGTAHRDTIDTAYYYNLYNISKGTGIVPSFSKLDSDVIDQVLKAKFYGKNYSERVWGNSTKLSNEIRDILTTAVITGQGSGKTARTIRERFGVKRFEASRLVRTETAHFNTEATDLSFKSMGVEEWIYVATLDSRTDDICGSLDGEKFRVGEGPIIPIHPSCRCCKRAFLGKEFEPDQRIMRNAKGKNSYIGQVTFNQWKELVL